MKVIIDKKEIERQLVTCANSDTHLVVEAEEYVGGSYYPINFIGDGGRMVPHVYRMDYDCPTSKGFAETLIEQGMAYSTKIQADECAELMMQTALDYKNGKLK